MTEADTTAAQRTSVDRRALRFLHGLTASPADEQAAEEGARSLGIDPRGTFTAAVCAPAHGVSPVAEDVHVVEQTDRVIAISTRGGAPSRAEVTLGDLLRRHNLHHVGVGVMRQGIAGARESLKDAEAAFRAAVALDAAVITFRGDWLACVGLMHVDQLEVLVAPAVQALRNDEDLCVTLEAFLDADGSMTATGKALFVHPNTVAYRLRQFAQRTGIEPRTPTGVTLTQLALTYSRATPRSSAAPPLVSTHHKLRW